MFDGRTTRENEASGTGRSQRRDEVLVGRRERNVQEVTGITRTGTRTRCRDSSTTPSMSSRILQSDFVEFTPA